MNRYEYLIEKTTGKKPFRVIHSHDNNKILTYGGLERAAINSLYDAFYYPKGTRGKIIKARLIIEIENEEPREANK